MKGSISISTFKGNKSSNQDRFSVDAKIISHDSPRIDCELEFELDETYHVVAVADGVTNSIDGGKAAEFVVKAIYDSYEEGVLTFEDEKDDVKETLKDCFDKIMDNVASMLRWEYKDFISDVSVASTISVVMFNNKNIWAYNLGDSPILLIRENRIISLFHEDTLGAEKLRKQKERNIADRLFFKEAPPTEREFNCLTKCVSNHCYQVDGNLFTSELQDEDIILIASDGLLKAIKEDEIIGCNNSKKLIDKTLGKASDNVTVAVIRKEGEDTRYVAD